jgi:hypothetical protein
MRVQNFGDRAVATLQCRFDSGSIPLWNPRATAVHANEVEHEAPYPVSGKESG